MTDLKKEWLGITLLIGGITIEDINMVASIFAYSTSGVLACYTLYRRLKDAKKSK